MQRVIREQPAKTLFQTVKKYSLLLSQPSEDPRHNDIMYTGMTHLLLQNQKSRTALLKTHPNRLWWANNAPYWGSSQNGNAFYADMLEKLRAQFIDKVVVEFQVGIPNPTSRGGMSLVGSLKPLTWDPSEGVQMTFVGAGHYTAWVLFDKADLEASTLEFQFVRPGDNPNDWLWEGKFEGNNRRFKIGKLATGQSVKITEQWGKI